MPNNYVPGASVRHLFRKDEAWIVCREALQAAPDGLNTRELATLCLASKDFDANDAALRKGIQATLASLGRRCSGARSRAGRSERRRGCGESKESVTLEPQCGTSHPLLKKPIGSLSLSRVMSTYQPEICACFAYSRLSVSSVPTSAAPSYAVPLVGFKSNKAAQLCAYFAVRSNGIIDKLKLIKLVYIAERAFVREHHIPMLFDELYSLPHGPICSSTLDGLNQIIDKDVWSRYILMHGNQAVAVKSFSREDLDEISDAEYAYIESTWGDFGGKTASQLRNWSHENCSEYTEITEGRVPISYADVLNAFGEEDAAETVEREIKQIRVAENILA